MPPGAVVDLVETPAGVYSVRGGLMRRIPTEAERIARLELRRERVRAKAAMAGKVLDVLAANKGATYLLVSAAIGAGMGRTIGASGLNAVTGIKMDLGGLGTMRLGYPVAVPTDPAKDKAYGMAQGAGFGAFVGSLFYALQEAVELRSVSLAGSLV